MKVIITGTTGIRTLCSSISFQYNFIVLPSCSQDAMVMVASFQGCLRGVIDRF